MPHIPYRGDAYRDFPWIEGWCQSLAKERPDMVSLSTYGKSRHDLPLLLLTLSLGDGAPEDRPAFWLDGGTHASEWAGVMATLYAVSRWVESVDEGDAEALAFFKRHTIYVVPCISPDGFQHMADGGAFVRSTLRGPQEGRRRRGLEPRDMDGNGEILWMRWRHPAGTWVSDSELPSLLRRRRLGDDPEDAYFACPEGVLLDHDGVSWQMAPAKHALDLNRNFPVAWSPFRQFGQDSGVLPLSEPESRAVAEAVVARPNICAVLTNHTYTGAILVGPYREDSPVNIWDREVMWQLASEAVDGTGYSVFRVCPDFMYVKGVSIPGVWADFLTTNRGIPAYTLEIWDPYGHAGVRIENPARNFFRPDEAAIRKTVKAFVDADPSTAAPWTEFEHPQLGSVEIGGFRQRFTVRNPPVAELASECHKAFNAADKVRRSLPKPWMHAEVHVEGDVKTVEVTVENRGYLNTACLQRAVDAGIVPAPHVSLELPAGSTLVGCEALRSLPQLGGWGDSAASFRRHPLFNVLPQTSPRVKLTWVVRGSGKAKVTYSHPRSGSFDLAISIP